MNIIKSFYSFSHTKDKDAFLMNFATTCTLEMKSDRILGTQLGKGVYGSAYIKKGDSSRCIKLIDTGIRETVFDRKEIFNENYSGIYSEAKCIQNIMAAFLEAFYLYQSKKTKITPVFYNMYFVKHKGRIFPAIEMERVEGQKLCDVKKFRHKKNNRNLFVENNKVVDKKSGATIQNYIRQKMAKAKLQHKDSHWGNIILMPKTNEVKVIDFSSTFIKYKVNNRYKFFRIYIKEKKVVFAKQERKRKYTIKFTERMVW